MKADFDFRKIKKRDPTPDDENLIREAAKAAGAIVSAYEDYEKRHKATIAALNDPEKADAFLQAITYKDIKHLAEGDGIPEEYTERIRRAFTGDNLETRRNVFFDDFSIFEAVPLYETYFEQINAADYIIEESGQLKLNILRPQKPKDTIFNTTKVGKELQKHTLPLLKAESKQEITVSPAKAKKQTAVILELSRLEGIEIYGDTLTTIDLLNLKAAHDLYEAGNEFITADMVYRARKGITDARKVYKTTTEATRRSLQKMSMIKITIDYAEHMKMNYPGIDTSRNKFQRTRALLPIDEVQVVAGGVEVWAFRFLKPAGKKEEDPILLYQYAKDVKQLATLPIELLNINDTVQRANDNDDILINYLLEQIVWMKRPGSERNNKIAYAGIYTELYGDKEISRKVRGNTRKKTQDILYSFQHKKFIKGYDEYKEGRKVIGINIVI